MSRRTQPIAVWAQSLGCPKNRVDSERLLGSLGRPVRMVSQIGRSQLVFINTCAFIEPACRESIRALLDAVAKINTLKRKPLLVAAGCLPGRYGLTDLAREFPDVDLWLLPENQASWPNLLAEKLDCQTGSGRVLSTGPSYAWLKIADGCNHRCSFCAIPGIKGPAVSDKREFLLREAAELLAQGISEIDIVAQDVLSWGRDFQKSVAAMPPLLELLADLAVLPGLMWLRLFYLYPAAITPEFLEKMAAIGAPLLPYLDIPFQHSEMEVLAAMGRPFKKNPREILTLVRSIMPDCAVRSTLMVGFPGETEKEFQKLCDFVEEARFHNLGVFVFHPEDGTPAAKFEKRVSNEIALERQHRLMEIQARISGEILAESVGSHMDVLVDRSCHDEWPGLYAGRVWFQAPEIDGVTYISGPGVEAGRMLKVEIMDSHTYDLSALA